jgi:hypothetical protein
MRFDPYTRAQVGLNRNLQVSMPFRALYSECTLRNTKGHTDHYFNFKLITMIILKTITLFFLMIFAIILIIRLTTVVKCTKSLDTNDFVYIIVLSLFVALFYCLNLINHKALFD